MYYNLLGLSTGASPLLLHALLQLLQYEILSVVRHSPDPIRMIMCPM